MTMLRHTGSNEYLKIHQHAMNQASAAELPPHFQSHKNLNNIKRIAHLEDERKTICFVITDEEVFFGRELLVKYSPYIKQLVQDLDPNKVILISCDNGEIRMYAFYCLSG